MTTAPKRNRHSFSAAGRQHIEELFQNTRGIPGFVKVVEGIIFGYVSEAQGGEGLPPQKLIQTNARAIHQDAEQLLRSIGKLSEAERRLLGQLMWVNDKIAFYPGPSSVEQVVRALTVLDSAAQGLNAGGRRGRTSLRLEGFVRAVHTAYKSHLRPAAAGVSPPRKSEFAQLVRICLKETGTVAPTGLAGIVRGALTET